ncbi:MAG: hypothetical protein FWF96_00210 [Kiritimatiellaeota bacterium]|nr:hypothetical protein [Kiritimatiellota bacterium]
MIDELAKAAKAIENAGIAPPQDWHPKLKTLPKATKKAPCARVWLTAEGRIDDIEPLPEEQAARLFKYEPDAGKSLPGFNVFPLYRVVKNPAELKGAAKALDGALAKPDFCWDAHLADGEDFWERTRKVLGQLKERVLPGLRKICGENLNPAETLAKFFDALEKLDATQFQQDYEAAAKIKIREGLLPASLLCYFVDAEKKRKEDADSNVPVPKTSVFLDVRDYTDFPVAHERTIARLNSLLWGNPAGEAPAQNEPAMDDDSRDAYGLGTDGAEEKFAQVALPFLGGVILRSQVKDKPTQARYGLCEALTFRAGSESRKRAKRALTWLGDAARSGMTNGVAGDGELLFAYPAVIPKTLPQLSLMLGAGRDDVLAEQKFTSLAQTVVNQLKGSGTAAANNGELEIFSLRKMDKARTKVVYYRNTTVALLEAASLAWEEGCANIPLLDIRDWSVKTEANPKSRPEPVESGTPFPLKITRCLNTVWKQTGEQAGMVKTFTPTDGLRLLLDGDSQGLASAMLARFNQNARGWLMDVCRRHGRGEISSVADKRFYPAIFGLLLHKLEHRKETYMNENAFLLGRCLRIADELHRLYCGKVRGGDMPPELCGGSLLLSMQENPVATMAQLAQRGAPYIKWANAYHGDDGGLVRHWFRLWGDNANEIKAAGGVPLKRLDHAQRAEVFLGYLASFPKKEKNVDMDVPVGSTEDKPNP